MVLEEDNNRGIYEEIRSPDTALRRIDPSDLQDFLMENWEQIQVRSAPQGQLIEKEVHGEVKRGTHEVYVGSLLTENHAGTELSAEDFVRWMSEEGFTPFNSTQVLPINDAIDLLESSELSQRSDVTGGIPPLLRLLRPADSRRVPMCFEFFGGSRSLPMQIISEIGNKSDITSGDKELYRTQVFRLIQPFGAKGTTEVKRLMEVPRDVAKEKCVDDCLASLMTFVGWAELKKHLGIDDPNSLLEWAGAVGTTQALVTAKAFAESAGKDNPMKHPLVVRVGAPAFGLGDEKTGLNYIMNAQPDMLRAHGSFACGDFGAIMSEGKEKFIQPHLIFFGNSNPSYRNVLFLNGGGPIYSMLMQQYSERTKPINGQVVVVRASRVGERDDWGVLITPPEAFLQMSGSRDVPDERLFDNNVML